MEENKSKKSRGVSLILVIAILVIALVGCITYIMKNNEQKLAINNNNSEKTINELRTEITNLKNTLENKKMTSDEKYKIFAKQLKNEVSKYGDTANIKSVFCRADEGDGSWYEVCLNSNGSLSLHFGNEELDKKYGTESLVKNVIAFYIIDVGQDDWHSIYFINEDGTVGSAYVDAVIFNGSGKIEIENKISGLKNIVSILDGGIGLQESGTHRPLFVDINGKVYHNN